jgi:hypothetical protein
LLRAIAEIQCIERQSVAIDLAVNHAPPIASTHHRAGKSIAFPLEEIVSARGLPAAASGLFRHPGSVDVGRCKSAQEQHAGYQGSHNAFLVKQTFTSYSIKVFEQSIREAD